MVTKLRKMEEIKNDSLILAKIHMVTKLCQIRPRSSIGLILAKIHMVTKLITNTEHE